MPSVGNFEVHLTISTVKKEKSYLGFSEIKI